MEPIETTAPAKPRKHVKAKSKKKAKRPAKPRTKKHAKAKKKSARKSKAGVVVRSERLDMRLTKAEKAKIYTKAKKTRRTVTSLVIEAIEKIR